MFAWAEDIDDDPAMVELEVAAARDSVIACQGRRTDQVGRCVECDRGGDTLRQFSARLLDDPLGQATAVWRA